MGLWEIVIIIILSITLLKPKDIKILINNIINLITNLNKYFNLIKINILKIINKNN